MNVIVPRFMVYLFGNAAAEGVASFRQEERQDETETDPRHG
jgi:hypothetical protein